VIRSEKNVPGILLVAERATKNLPSPLTTTLPVLSFAPCGKLRAAAGCRKTRWLLISCIDHTCPGLSDSITHTFAAIRIANMCVCVCVCVCVFVCVCPSHTYISCNYYSSRGISASTAESLGEVRPERSWKIEKSISIFVHELYVNSRASAYEPGEISHYPVCFPPMGSKFQEKMKHKNIITVLEIIEVDALWQTFRLKDIIR